tara:strand:+ start:231 stop:692 length:462 start_codon:yes stop_codon:yes gene_type:complete
MLMRILLYIFILLNSISLYADVIKPNPDIKPIDVIYIQLKALQNNNDPFKNAGILQTWEFAHPKNRAYTGPLSNFIIMMNKPSYSMMIDHLDHKIILVEENKDVSYYFVELIDAKGNKYGFQWTISKVIDVNEYKDCWMTIGVSAPIPLTKSI